MDPKLSVLIEQSLQCRPTKRTKTTEPKQAIPSTSDSEEESEDEHDTDREAMLAALEAHGKLMFGGLETTVAGPSKPIERLNPSTPKADEQRHHSAHDLVSKANGRTNRLDGWDDILSDESEADSELESGEGFDEDDGENGFSDDGSKGQIMDSSSGSEIEEEVPTVVFDSNMGKPTSLNTSKADFKRFMVCRFVLELVITLFPSFDCL